jgi:hypothetical protein
VEEPGLLPAEGSPIRYVKGVSGTEISREEYERLIQEEIEREPLPELEQGRDLQAEDELDLERQRELEADRMREVQHRDEVSREELERELEGPELSR